LLNTNENATVAKTQNFRELNTPIFQNFRGVQKLLCWGDIEQGLDYLKKWQAVS